ncbi:MAG: tRNA (cytosine(32)/uridine(32)-2'-O)-methyltransferase TrmJ [Gammaproteobacteria bacterium]
MLTNVRIVLVETSHPGNIGGAARAMKTMGLRGLWLVRPAQFPHAEATARASGADDVLAQARTCASLDEALVGCRLVAGASARQRRLAWPEAEPRDAAPRLLAEAAAGPVALVFGRESSGLTNDELAHCHLLVHIPVNPDYGSLNLAAAVQVLSYELALAARGGNPGAASADAEQPAPAGADQMARFYEHLERVLIELEFLDPDHPKHLMRRLKRLFNRARPDEVEMNVLRGILTAVQRDRRRS